jgi:hypothetical protein
VFVIVNETVAGKFIIDNEETAHYTSLETFGKNAVCYF